MLKNSYIKNEVLPLTSFRFITAFIVFLFHCKIHFGYNFGIKIIDRFLDNGAVFMTGFFVLSGYIMCHVYLNKNFENPKEIVEFYLKRVAKIYPTYLIGSVVFFIFIAPPTPYLWGDWLRIIVNDLFVVQAFFPNMFQLGLNGGTWSISVEFFFYFLFPLTLLLFKNNPLKLYLLALIGLLIININILGEHHSIGKNTLASYYSNPIMRVSEFLIGISFYLLSKQTFLHTLPRLFKSASFIFCLIFGLTVSHLSSAKFQFLGEQFLIAPLFALLIFNCHHIKFGPMYNSKTLNYLGKISYSFYIWQFLAMEIGKYIQKHYTIHVWYIMLIALFFNIFISALSYHFIEERFRKYIIGKSSIFKKVTLKLKQV